MSSVQQTFLIDCIKVDDDVFKSHLQDKGVAPNDPSYNNIKTRFYKSHDGYKFQDIWKLSKLYADKLKEAKDRFPRFPSNRDTCGIYQLRDHVEGRFTLSQESLHTKFAAMWGHDNESGGPTMSDKARVFGIITKEEYRDDLKILVGKNSSAADSIGRRVDIDDPSLNNRNIWARIKTDFHDARIVISHPGNWQNAKEIDGFADINPNDPQRMLSHINRDIQFFKRILFKDVLSVYRVAAKKYRSDTGNGSGQPENFLDWDVSEDIKFQNFCRGQSVALLTWIFMKDRELQYILEEDKETIPDGIVVEDRVAVDVEDNISSLSRRSRSPQMLKGLNDIIKTTNTTMNSMLRTISNNNNAEGGKDSNMNYHDMARTLELTDTLIARNQHAEEGDEALTEEGRRKKRIKLALQKIQDVVMDSLGC